MEAPPIEVAEDMVAIPITDWAFAVPYFNEYRSPESLTYSLAGAVAKTPHAGTPGRIITSRCLSVDLGKRIVTTKNSTYRLVGPPNQEWLDSCVNKEEILRELANS